MIQNINIEKLHPHPDNLRKEIGDISELVESIKTQGILQNLTVVELDKYEKGYYRIVIGHRRYEAAKLAGLNEVPCVISTMDYRTQLGTMLLENMQRADLTVYEQAQGFQMMINFGESFNSIADKTGFSETTIRRRMKLLELDPEKFKESANRNVTLMEYVELEKIKSIELKNKVLDSIGTQNFKYELQRAIDTEKKEKWMVKAIEKLDSFATKIEKIEQSHKWITCYYPFREDEIEIPDDADEKTYYYLISDYGNIELFCDKEEEQEVGIDLEREKERDRYDALSQIRDRAYGLRRDFVMDISGAKAKKNIGLIIENTIRSIADSYGNLNYEDFANMHGSTTPDDGDEDIENLIDDIRKSPEKSLLIATFLYMDGGNQGYITWNSQYMENEELDKVYDMLESLGYEMSDDEQALRNGTHDLFIQGSE